MRKTTKFFPAFAALVLSAWPVQAAHWSPLPDTGQTSCYDESGSQVSCGGTGQDGEIQGQPPSYSIRTVSNETIVLDNNTGLGWQQVDDGTERTWAEANEYCTTLNFAGYTGWRLPALFELLSIVDYGRDAPAMDPVFKETGGNYGKWYWTGSTYLGNSNGQGWKYTVGFHRGQPNADTADSTATVRCVRDM